MWWNGYKGQEVILFDDNAHRVSFDAALTMTHEYAHTEETKGGDVEVNAAWYIFTNNWHWRTWKNWQGNSWEAWERRITDVIEMKWDVNPRTGVKSLDVKIIKGEIDWENLVDPPRERAEGLTDEQVEEVLMKEPTSKWLPAKKRKGLTVQEVVEQSVRTPAINNSIPDFFASP